MGSGVWDESQEAKKCCVENNEGGLSGTWKARLYVQGGTAECSRRS